MEALLAATTPASTLLPGEGGTSAGRDGLQPRSSCRQAGQALRQGLGRPALATDRVSPARAALRLPAGAAATQETAERARLLDNALFAHAESVSSRFFGRDVYYRGIVEFSNVRACAAFRGACIRRGGRAGFAQGRPCICTTA